MYTGHNILDFNPIFIFDFASKLMLTSLFILFLFIKTNIFNLVYIVIIDIRLNIFMWFRFSTYFIIFLQNDLIHCMINNIIVLLLFVTFISSCGIMPTVLRRPDFKTNRNKYPKTLHSSDEYSGPWTRQVCLDLSLKISLRFTALYLIF